MNGETLTETEIAIVKRARLMRYVNHEIASYFGVNQGRVAEINTKEVGAHVQPADTLPADFPPPVRRAKIVVIRRVDQIDLFSGPP